MRKWVATLVAITMTLNTGLQADADPDASTEQPSLVDEASGYPAEQQSVTEETGAENNSFVAPTPAEEATTPETNATETAKEEAAIEESQPEPPQFAEVGRGSSDAVREASKRRWQRIGIAVGAVAVATIALILVSHNHGHNS